MYRTQYSKKAIKDIERLKESGLAGKAKDLIAIIRENPYKNPPRYEKLGGAD